MELFKLSEVVSVQSRFGRSVNLERDFYNRVSLDGYVLTTTAQNALSRLTGALADNTAARAWTLTGAYGSGKSTFALFTAKLFGYKQAAETLQAQNFVREKDFALWQKIFEKSNKAPKFFPILVSGSREPLAQAILRGVKTALLNADNKGLLFVLASVEALETAEIVTGKQILELLAEVSNAINQGTKNRVGLLVVIDELGKLLEFVAQRPTESDIFLLQELAEATRKTETPFFLLTILHQAFERYAERLGRREREEWMKVQGRFEDLVFQEPNEQILYILQNAFVKNRTSPHSQVLQRIGERLARTAYDWGLCGTQSEHDAVSLLTDCLPLHPIVSLTLGQIFRRFGQNERSLFAFLTSNEAFGLTEFLDTTAWSETEYETITLDRIYDYLVSAMGSTLYAGAEGRRWAEIENALNRSADASALEVRLIKSVGLLQLLGELGKLKSSRKILRFALTDSTTNEADVDHALDKLHRKSIFTERLFNDTFVVWEGSDINLDERFREAERKIDPAISLAASLTEYFRPRPIVAKRHSHNTGTLRYFEVIYADASDVNSICQQDLSSADGKIIVALTANQAELSELQEKILQKQISVNPQIVFAVPKVLNGLREAVLATACWRWVRQNTPELENDRPARTELAARLFHAEQTVVHWLEDLQNNTASDNCHWFWQGEEKPLPTARHLQEFLSDVFEFVFSNTPVLLNELINRPYLSSAATSGRRALFEAMLANSTQPQLKIENFPPQLSMYFSILEETTIHREENGKFGFYPPSESADKGIRAVWQRIENFLEETEIKRLTIADLFQILQRPPFGLKAGVLPILLVAVLLHYDAEVALYERGNFLPKLTMPIFERLCRTPEAFTLQLCRIVGVRAEVLDKMAEVLLPQRNNSNGKSIDVLNLVRPLARFAQEVEDYTQHTSRLSPVALGIRRALFAGREPDKLIFKQLPEACGFAEFAPNDDNVNDSAVEDFAHALHGGLAELRRAYPELLREVEEMLVLNFALREAGEAARAELHQRSQQIAEFAASPKLKSFILRVSDTDLDLRTWLESVAALLAGKPPAVWRDDDIARFEIRLAEIVRSFLSLETLSFERRNRDRIGNASASEVKLLRLSLTQMGETEQERVLSIRPEDEKPLEETEKLLRKAFDESPLNGNLNLRLAALANLSLSLLEQTENRDVHNSVGKTAKGSE